MVDGAKSPFWNGGRHLVDQNLDGVYTFDLNKWHHYVLTLDGKVGMVYVDGKLVGQKEEALVPPAFDSVSFWLGTGETPNTWLVEDSIFDEVFVTDNVLTLDEVTTIMKGNFIAVGSLGKLASTWADLKSK
jgi:hypothetical protein